MKSKGTKQKHGSQKEPKGTKRNQKEPKGTKRNQKEPKGTKRNKKTSNIRRKPTKTAGGRLPPEKTNAKSKSSTRRPEASGARPGARERVSAGLAWAAWRGGPADGPNFWEDILWRRLWALGTFGTLGKRWGHERIIIIWNDDVVYGHWHRWPFGKFDGFPWQMEETPPKPVGPIYF